MPNNFVTRCCYKHQYSDITTNGSIEGALAKTGAYFKRLLYVVKRKKILKNGWEFNFFEWLKTGQSERSAPYF